MNFGSQRRHCDQDCLLIKTEKRNTPKCQVFPCSRQTPTQITQICLPQVNKYPKHFNKRPIHTWDELEFAPNWANELPLKCMPIWPYPIRLFCGYPFREHKFHACSPWSDHVCWSRSGDVLGHVSRVRSGVGRTQGWRDVWGGGGGLPQTRTTTTAIQHINDSFCSPRLIYYRWPARHLNKTGLDFRRGNSTACQAIYWSNTNEHSPLFGLCATLDQDKCSNNGWTTDWDPPLVNLDQRRDCLPNLSPRQTRRGNAWKKNRFFFFLSSWKWILTCRSFFRNEDNAKGTDKNKNFPSSPEGWHGEFIDWLASLRRAYQAVVPILMRTLREHFAQAGGESDAVAPVQTRRCFRCSWRHHASLQLLRICTCMWNGKQSSCQASVVPSGQKQRIQPNNSPPQHLSLYGGWFHISFSVKGNQSDNLGCFLGLTACWRQHFHRHS